jgi:hypothetical protein
MRKIAIALLALSLTAIAVAPAGAVGLFAETFTYANGNLVPNGSPAWATHSGTGTDIQVTSGVAVGNMANAPDDNRALSADQLGSAKTYMCFNAMIPSATSPITNYFIHLKDTGSSNFVGRVYVMPLGNQFTFGLSVGTCNSAASPPCFPAPWPHVLNYGQWYTVVVSYDGTAASSELWVDPFVEADEKITMNTWSGTTSQGNVAVHAVALREAATAPGFSGNTWTYNVDNIGVGTTFNDACTSAPVPTLNSTWGRVKTLYRN